MLKIHCYISCLEISRLSQAERQYFPRVAAMTADDRVEQDDGNSSINSHCCSPASLVVCRSKDLDRFVFSHARLVGNVLPCGSFNRLPWTTVQASSLHGYDESETPQVEVVFEGCASWREREREREIPSGDNSIDSRFIACFDDFELLFKLVTCDRL